MLADQRRERERLEQHWAERRKRADYEVRLAERQYGGVDPENRLVAAELERRWEEKLRERQTFQEEYDRFERQAAIPALTDEQRALFAEITTRLPELWHGNRLHPSQKKELLRSLIDRVILRRSTADRIEVKIVWVSGHYSVKTAHPTIWRERDVTGYEAMVARVEELWQEGWEDEAIAHQLTEEGFRSARSMEVVPLAVQKIRLQQGWFMSLHQSRNAQELDGHLTPRGLAERLGVKRSRVYHWIYEGKIAPAYLRRHPQSRVHLIRDDPALIEELRTWL